MMIFAPKTRVFLAPGATDMGKAINGLSLMVETLLDQDPLAEQLIAFFKSAKAKVPHAQTEITSWSASLNIFSHSPWIPAFGHDL